MARLSAMAEGCVDQGSLPGVKEVCRDFAVLEDHSLAHSLQEQEIESHLASNVYRTRLVQRDIQVARRLQEEEDLRARTRPWHLHRGVEQSDNEVAQEIQEQLVHRARMLQLQEEKDEAIARKLQEKEFKDSRKKSKKQVVTFEERSYEDKGAFRFHRDPRSLEAQSLDWGHEPLLLDPIREKGSNLALLGADRSRLGFSRGDGGEPVGLWDPADAKMAMQKKEKPARPPPPQVGYDSKKEMSRDGGREGEKDRDLLRDRVADGKPQRNGCPDDFISGGTQAQVMWASGSQSPDTLAAGQESSLRQGESWREPLNPLENAQENKRSPCPAQGPDWSRRAPCSTRDLIHLDMQDQELRDIELARRLQEKELKACQMDKQAAQVAQDEEIAWLIMQEEKKYLKKSRILDKIQPEGDVKLGQEEMVRLRLQEESDVKRTRSQKPTRPPPPLHGGENVASSYTHTHSRPSCSSPTSGRLETTQKGSFCRQ